MANDSINGLNRQQKRKAERTLDKNEKWIRSLPHDKLMIIDRATNNAVKNSVTKVMDQIETCYAGALISLYDEILSFDDIEEMFKLANEYLIENGNFLSKYGEDWKMKLNENEKEVKNRIKELLNKNMAQNAIVAAIKKEFVDLENSYIKIAYKTAKEEWCKGDFKPAINLKGKNAKVIIDDAIEVLKVEEVAPDVIIESQEETFKILEKVLKFEGKYSEYMIKNNVLTAGEITFSSLEDIENYKHNQQLELNNMIKELEKAFKMV